ncbi:MAG: SMC family ATPase [Zavarzinella sp.]
MIPQRLTLEGFLSYRTAQTIDFSNANIWMLSGANGSGKSAVFDAMTYALYGYHRGGGSGYTELINKQANEMKVAFEFQIDGKNYLIKRGYKRTRGGDQAIFERLPGAKNWTPIPQTDKVNDFKEWIQTHVGLDYIAFTSSVLLLQGKAEKLLDESPKGRAEVLSKIVNLERYVNLHSLADGKRKSLKGRQDIIQEQLAHVPEVLPADLEAANAHQALMQAQFQEITHQIEQLQRLLAEATLWNEIKHQMVNLEGQLTKQRQLLQQAGALETSFRRYQELQLCLPHVEVIHEREATVLEKIRELHETEKETTRLEEQIRKKRSVLHAHTTQRAAILEQQRTLETELAETKETRAELAQVIGKLDQYEELLQRIENDRVALDALPKDLQEQVATVQQQADELAELGRWQSHLVHIAQNRQELIQLRQELVECEEEKRKLTEQGKAAGKNDTSCQQLLAQASAHSKVAASAATQAKTLYEQAKRLADEFEHLDGQQICRVCGQELTPAHFLEEKTRRTKAMKEAAKEDRKAQQALEAAEKAETEARKKAEEATNLVEQARKAYLDNKKQTKDLTDDLQQLEQKLAQAFHVLPNQLQGKIAPTVPADWAVTRYPSAADLKKLETQLRQTDALRTRLKQLQQQLNHRNTLVGAFESLNQQLADHRKQLPNKDFGEIRANYLHIQTNEKSFQNKMDDIRKQRTAADQAQEKYTQAVNEAEQQLIRIQGELRSLRTARDEAQQTITRARESLPSHWQQISTNVGLADLNRWKGELEGLIRDQIADKYEKSRTAQSVIQLLEGELQKVMVRANTISSEAKVPPEQVSQRIETMKAASQNSQAQLKEAEKQVDLLLSRVKMREEYQTQVLEAGKELQYYDILTQLLGRDRLQRFLVRTAEQQIVFFANAILDRLSSGSLALQIAPTEEGIEERALHLVVINRHTGDAAIGVEFLSGSQKFRVAVSLALAIGQYSSRQHRPMESVIIDEGFGSLDNNGRLMMLQELQQLQGQLKRILLVSHQEDFAQAFPNRVQFDLSGGETQVTHLTMSS